ncbi:MAG: type II toxin-antitoxin system RelE/ParE family toxin [Hyphomicrobiales bacterium]|nr:type II toxin-antitoxin system RelE/ParE family toxin [Rickettsiales bacterium]MCP5361743.1 type II toxin-antitoxin system RelE/ParE family toxin [Hyphomicrobiales bacterium]
MSIIAITELPPFTKKVAKILSQEEQEALRTYLIQHPGKGDIIPGTGGIRKLRWAASGRGKRGGARVIYYYFVAGAEIYLMTCYKKNEREDITADEKKQLRKLVSLLTKRGG